MQTAPIEKAPIEKASVCTLDCPDTCSLTVTVENDRVVKIRGSHANPLTQGTICKKVTFSYPEYIHGPDRIMTPLRRTGAKASGEFEPLSWDSALDIIHENVIIKRAIIFNGNLAHKGGIA